MKKIIAGLLCAAAVSGAAFAQEATFYNKVGTKAVTQAPVKDAEVAFGNLYNETRAIFEADKFSLWGEITLSVNGRPGLVDREMKAWGDGAATALDPQFNAAFRPLDFLEVIVGSNAGDEGLWSAAYLPGAYGYGSDFYYGLSKWASGEGLTVAFRGAGVGIDGLTIGWNVLQANDENLTYKVGDDVKLGWNTAFAASYVIPELVGVGLGARIDSAEGANQQLGIYGELLAVANLKASLGVTLDTDRRSYSFSTDDERVVAIWAESGLVAALNAGAEYNFGGMNLPLVVGADLGMVLGTKEVFGDRTVMPLAVGGFVSYGILDNLTVDARVTYETPLANESEDNTSLLGIEPRVWFNVTEVDELRLDVPLKIVSQNNTHTTGFDVEFYWKHSF